MRHVLCAIVLSVLAGCATQRAHSGGMSSTQSEGADSSGASAGLAAGAGSGEPEPAYSPERPFSTDYLENQRRTFEVWEAGD